MTLKIPPCRPIPGATVVLLKTKWTHHDGEGKLIRICSLSFNLVDEIVDLDDGDGPQWRATDVNPHPIVRALAGELAKRQPDKLIDLTEIKKASGPCRIVVDTSRSGMFRVVGSADPDRCALLQQQKKNSCDEKVWDATIANSGLLTIYGFIFSYLYPNETINFSTISDVSLPILNNK